MKLTRVDLRPGDVIVGWRSKDGGDILNLPTEMRPVGSPLTVLRVREAGRSICLETLSSEGNELHFGPLVGDRFEVIRS